MIKFIHTADIHFGMENYGRIDPKSGIHSRLLDFEKALNFCIDYTLENNIDFFLFSGDAYKTVNPSPTQQRLLMRCFLRLYAAGIPIVIVVGNHDNPLSFGKASTLDIFGELPVQGFYVMSKPSALTLQTKNGPVQIVGIPWPSRTNISISNNHVAKSSANITEYISHAVSGIIKQFADSLNPSIPSVLAGHLTVSSGIFSGSEKRAIYGNDPVLLPSELAIPPFDYVGLGHLHRYQNLNQNGYPAIVYSGSIERIDFGERKEEKGFCVVKLIKNECTHEFVKTPTRPFIQIEVKLKAHEDQTLQILASLKKYDIKDAIIKILYHLATGTKDMVDLQKVVHACHAALYLVSITPIRIHEIRQQRASMNVDMDFETVLEKYFDSKPELKPKKADLIEKALALQNQILQEELDT